MVTLNELIELVEVEELTVYFKVTEGIKPRQEFPMKGQRFEELRHKFGECRVLRVGAAFNADPRVVVEIDPKLPA